jgi:hypothetical protein
MEVRKTWLATKILPVRDRLLWPQFMSFPLKGDIILSKFAFVGRRKPI